MKQPSLKMNSSSKCCFILISYHKSYKKVTKRIRQAVKLYASPLRKGHQFSFFSNLNGISGKRQIPLSTYSSVMKNLLICKPVSVRAYGMLQGPSVASTPSACLGSALHGDARNGCFQRPEDKIILCKCDALFQIGPHALLL